MTWYLGVTVGSLNFLVEGPADPDDDPPELPAVLAASWTDSLLEDGAWPSIQNVSTGSLSVLFETAEEAAFITSTTVASMRLLLPGMGLTPAANIAGRCSEPKLTPHPRGVVAELLISDYLADLNEYSVGDSDYPIETVGDRLDRMFDDAGLTGPEEPEPAVGEFLMSFPLVARDKAPGPLLALAQEALGSGLYSSIDYLPPPSDPDDVYPGNLGLFELRPNLDTDYTNLDPTEPWVLVPLPRTTVNEGATINAGTVLFGGSWQRRRFTDTNTVHVITGNKVLGRASNRDGTEPRVLYRRSSQVANAENADALAEYLLPDTDYLPDWEAETFTIELDAAPEGYWPGQLRDWCTLANIQPRHNPSGSFLWAGTMTALTTSIDRGRLAATVTLSARPTDFALSLHGGFADTTEWDLDPFHGGHADTTEWDYAPDLGDAS